MILQKSAAASYWAFFVATCDFLLEHAQIELAGLHSPLDF